MRIQLLRAQTVAARNCSKITNLQGQRRSVRSFPEYNHDTIDFLGLTSLGQHSVRSANRKIARQRAKLRTWGTDSFQYLLQLHCREFTGELGRVLYAAKNSACTFLKGSTCPRIWQKWQWLATSILCSQPMNSCLLLRVAAGSSEKLSDIRANLLCLWQSVISSCRVTLASWELFSPDLEQLTLYPRGLRMVNCNWSHRHGKHANHSGNNCQHALLGTCNAFLGLPWHHQMSAV